MASAGGEGEGANESIGVGGRGVTTTDVLNPGINGSGVSNKVANRIRITATSVTRVGIAHDNEGHTSGPGVDPRVHLSKVLGTSVDIARIGASVGVEVVKINPDTFGNANTGEGEALGGKAVTAVEVTVVPTNTFIINEGEIGECVQTRTNACNKKAQLVGQGDVLSKLYLPAPPEVADL